MRRAIVRSTLFNILFYGLNAVACIFLIPFFAAPRPWIMGLVQAYVRAIAALEYIVLGLRYEVRGREHLPASGAYIVAAKHQSPYETFKLHLLFRDPAIVLKQELLRIPLWGTYLKKTDVIAIDRSSPSAAIESIQRGAMRMKEQGRPIVIFPQGTRVSVDATPTEKPYKIGVSRMQEATQLPVVPMALNSGMFWPKAGWLKSGGTVIFEFLPPIPPGQPAQEVLRQLEQHVEAASRGLMEEARQKNMVPQTEARPWVVYLIGAAILALFALYSHLWFYAAGQIKTGYAAMKAQIRDASATDAAPMISGYPGPLTAYLPHEFLRTPTGSIAIDRVVVRGWPLPWAPITLQTGPIKVQYFRWRGPMFFDSFDARFHVFEKTLTVHDSDLRLGSFHARARGSIDFAQQPFPRFDMTLALYDYQTLLATLAHQKIMDRRSAILAAIGMGAFDQGDHALLPLQQRNDMLYAGPLAIAKIPGLGNGEGDITPRRRFSPVVTEIPAAPDP